MTPSRDSPDTESEFNAIFLAEMSNFLKVTCAHFYALNWVSRALD